MCVYTHIPLCTSELWVNIFTYYKINDKGIPRSMGTVNTAICILTLNLTPNLCFQGQRGRRAR